MGFKKNARVQFQHQGRDIHGVVQRGGAKASVLEDGTTNTWRVPQRMLKASDKPLEASPVSSFTKNDRVEFDGKDGVILGVVTRGGARISVVADGGVLKYSVPPAILRHSKVPLPKDPPHEMDRWQLSGFKSYPSMSEETLCFETNITFDGKKVLCARNAGHGGCDSFYALDYSENYEKKFSEAVIKWMEDNGFPDCSGDLSVALWMKYKTDLAPYGVLASDYCKKEHDEWIEMSSGSLRMSG
ncbi:hypothetical protein [Roseibium sp. RKSG952]|uniref:hypothetical protein n=1 Tax=Roseibium sp. RKSG952 TaxID=2529384 RepID=UPI0012BB4DCB|nr:hypothetical protein [Roseibium sp. RKSG952]MTH95624.1 hypothetical protein [Roseibium sp. RKSG952]